MISERNGGAMGITVKTLQLTNFEELASTVKGASSEVIQLDPGRVSGFISNLSIDGLPVNVGSFSVGVRTRGVLSPDRTTIGMLTSTDGRVVHWSRDMAVGDVLVTPPGVEYGGRYFGGASILTISLSDSDILSFFAQEPRICDLESWKKIHLRGVPDSSFVPRLLDILRQAMAMHSILTDDAIAFWRRAIIEMMTLPVVRNVPAEALGPLASALKIVREVEDYVDRNSLKPIHISEVCNRLKVSRRSLHRAFHETFGMGPVTFLRRKRLCSVHTALLEADSRMATIADVAMQYGFINLGRFAGDYRDLFGEYPSHTLSGGLRKTRSIRYPDPSHVNMVRRATA
ncbi:helix-turn-helix domain-containing protein [Tardiphaga sp. 804_B3_N1_9]|uniref:helix-turn-helix domain-containing protein n=1 Tax=Tardiphaga sp. 804_B3_N1_9 TaxID=3240786 RepID=UPI003F28622B